MYSGQWVCGGGLVALGMTPFEFLDSGCHLLKSIGQLGNLTTDFRKIAVQTIIRSPFGKVDKLFDRQKYLAIQQGTYCTDRQDQHHRH